LYAGEEIGDWGEADAPLAETASLGDLGFQSGVASGWFAKVEFFSDPDLSAGPHQAFPLDRIVRHLAGQQNFDLPAEKISCCRIVRAQGLGPLSAPMAVETGGEHPRIVQDQQVVGAQQVGEFAKFPVLPALVRRPGGDARLSTI